jgi:uncharacterized protein
MTLNIRNKSIKLLTAAALLLGANMAFAAEPSPAKKELINKLIQLQQPGVDNIGRTILQQPLTGMMQTIGVALQQLPADKREATGKAMEAEIRKFADEVGPQLRERGIKLATPTWAPMLDEGFSEDELRQIVVWLESPVSKKYQQVGNDMLNALGQKVVGEMRTTLETRFKTLEQAVNKHLNAANNKPAASNGAAPKK